MDREPLQLVTPIRKNGEKGSPFFLAAATPLWDYSVEHAEDLVAAGYIKLISVPYVRTQIVGDKRRGR